MVPNNEFEGYLIPVFSNADLARKKSVNLQDLDGNLEIASGHWCLLAISVKDEKIYYVDSLGDNNSHVSRIGLINYGNKLKTALKIDNEYDFCFIATQIQERNDCGPLVCCYAEIILFHGLNYLFDEKLSFNRSTMRKLRLSHSNSLDSGFFLPKIKLTDKALLERPSLYQPLSRSTPIKSRKRSRNTDINSLKKRKRTIF